VARTLAMNPKVLLMDEPLSALDALTRATLQDEIADIWLNNKTTVIWITNDPDEAILVADRVIPLLPTSPATLGESITVDIERPRDRKAINHDPRFKKLRAHLITTLLDAKGKKQTKKYVVDTDEGPRADTSMDALAKLKPAFAAGGCVTAGNSSQTSDGSAFVIVMSERMVNELGLKPIARLLGCASAGVHPRIMGVGPIEAVPRVLKQVGMNLSQIDLIELNEAFASQSLAVFASWPRTRTTCAARAASEPIADQSTPAVPNGDWVAARSPAAPCRARDASRPARTKGERPAPPPAPAPAPPCGPPR